MNKEDKGVNHRNIHEKINSKGRKVRRQILVVKRRRAISVSREDKSRNKYRKKGENPMSSRLAVGKRLDDNERYHASMPSIIIRDGAGNTKRININDYLEKSQTIKKDELLALQCGGHTRY